MLARASGMCVPEMRPMLREMGDSPRANRLPYASLGEPTSAPARQRGNYKTLPNNVEAFGPDGESLGIVFETATPFDTPRLMGEFVAWTGNALASGELHPLLIITVFVVVFLEIHHSPSEPCSADLWHPSTKYQ